MSDLTMVSILSFMTPSEISQSLQLSGTKKQINFFRQTFICVSVFKTTGENWKVHVTSNHFHYEIPSYSYTVNNYTKRHIAEPLEPRQIFPMFVSFILQSLID